MRAILTIVVVAVLAYVGYEYVYLPQQHQTPQEQAQNAGGSAQQAVNKAGQALGEAANAIKNEAGQITDQAKQATQSATQQAGDAVQGAGQQAQNAGQQASDQTQAPAQADGVSAQFTKLVDNVKSGLQQANSGDTADAARGKLDDAKSQMNGLGDKLGQLPTAARQAFASTVSAALPTIKNLAQDAKNSQAGQNMAPTIDAIVTKFEDWSKPPA